MRIFEPVVRSSGGNHNPLTVSIRTCYCRMVPDGNELKGDFIFLFFDRNTQLYHQKNQMGMRNQEKENKMRQIRTDSTRRYHCAHLICAYLLANKKIRAAVTSREIALFHHLSRKSSQSISAMLNFLYTNHIRESRFGFYIMGTAPFRKCDYPHRYTIELIDEARGLL